MVCTYCLSGSEGSSTSHGVESFTQPFHTGEYQYQVVCLSSVGPGITSLADIHFTIGWKKKLCWEDKSHSFSGSRVPVKSFSLFSEKNGILDSMILKGAGWCLGQFNEVV